ncbi:hypothetical protein, partial [Bradyrhizobium sp. 62]|uniref:hypothetical protein n=1 Tax=Bradyrhizobium sp. 62 TaxID=1043588 RepID=UPI001FF83A39
GTTGTPRRLTIEGASTLTLASTFSVLGGNGSIGEQWETNGINKLTNNGTITSNVAGQGISIVPAAITNFANSTLTGGTWQVLNGATLRLILPQAIATNAATIVVDGASSSFFRDNGSTGALSGLTANAAGGSLTIANGYNFTSAGDFTNAGGITVGAGSTFGLGGRFDQTGGSVDLQGGVLGDTRPPSGNALHFDGNDFIETADSPTLHSSGDLTVERLVQGGWFSADLAEHILQG